MGVRDSRRVGLLRWLDGKIARWLDQSSTIGALLDPLADRIYIIVIPLAFGIRGSSRGGSSGSSSRATYFLALQIPLLRKRGITALPVLYVSKAAHIRADGAFPWILFGQLDNVVGRIALPFGWALLIWGIPM